LEKAEKAEIGDLEIPKPKDSRVYEWGAWS